TSEAGVRDLERQIAAVCRKVARRAAEGDETPVRVTRGSLERPLRAPRHPGEPPASDPQVGVAHRPARTGTGGQPPRGEVADTAGRGLVLTGQLGDVMKESAHAALTYARWRLAALGLDEGALTRRQIHLHVPAGAIPKDGPSAGVTMAAALISLATGI